MSKRLRKKFPLKKGNQRIDKLLTNLGLCSRTETFRYLRKNNITLSDGSLIKSKDFKVTTDQLLMDGKPFPYSAEPLHIALHKPSGYLCTAEKGEFKNVYDLLPPEYIKRLPKLGICGRLDKWVTGLVILTQDGKLQNRIINPKRKKKFPKIYIIEGRRPFTGEEAAIFKSGKLKLNGEVHPCRPAGFEIIDAEKNLAKITLYEGKYHQVRRMMAAVGNGVPKAITRIQIGNVSLKDLPLGKWRHLTPEELESFRPKKKKRKPRAKQEEDEDDEDEEDEEDEEEQEQEQQEEGEAGEQRKEGETKVSEKKKVKASKRRTEGKKEKREEEGPKKKQKRKPVSLFDDDEDDDEEDDGPLIDDEEEDEEEAPPAKQTKKPQMKETQKQKAKVAPKKKAPKRKLEDEEDEEDEEAEEDDEDEEEETNDEALERMLAKGREVLKRMPKSSLAFKAATAKKDKQK